MNYYKREEVYDATLEYFKGDTLATDVWINKYALKDSSGKIFEKTPDDMHKRISKELARIESKYENPLDEKTIFNLIKDFKYIVPQGSPMSGIGNDNQVVSLSNCFVIGNDADSYGGIFLTDQEQAQLMKRRGGVGHDLSHIRPKGSPVKNSALTSTGIVPFMERYSNTTREVAQDGRRGALMLSCFSDKTSVLTENGWMNIVDVINNFKKGKKIKSWTHEGYKDITNIQEFDNRDIYEIETESSDKIEVTSDHEFVVKNLENGKEYLKAIIDIDTDKEELILYKMDKITSKIKKITKKGKGKVYDFTVKDVHRILANNFYTSNCSINHPDSEDFIDAKIDTTKITGANVSVRIDDDFMKSIEKGEKYIQKFPVNSKNPIFEKTVNPNKIWNKIVHNAWRSAEPGILFWDTIIKESVADCYADLGFKTVSTNPCIVGDTLIATADGRNAVSIKQLTEEGVDVPVYSTNNEGKVEIKWGRNPRLTGKKKEVWKLIMDDGSELIATPDHKIYMKDNTYKELKDLKKGESISSFYSFNSNGGYRQISQVGSKMKGGRFRNRRQYRLIYEFFNGIDIDYSKTAIHHKDFNNKNDKYINISNEEILVHARKLYKEKGKFTSRMWIEYAKNNDLPQSMWNDFRFKTYTDFRNQVVDNHKVVSVEFYGYEDVYNITVDDNHNYNIITSNEDDNYVTSGGICVKNCGEITLCTYDSCRLVAINLYNYVDNPFTKDSKFNWDKFKDHVRYAQRFMDDIIDLEIEKIDKILEKIKKDPEEQTIKEIEINLWEKIKDKAIRGRRTGLGITAEGDMLASLGLIYGTKKATEFSIELHKVLAIEAYKSSAIMAKERGGFPIYDYDRESNSKFIQRLRKSDPDLDKMMKEWGRRNISLLTIAPTGSVSILTQTTSGIEPVFLTNYKRRRKINPNDKNSKSHFVDDNGDHWEEYTVLHHHFSTWLEKNGYDINQIDNLTQDELSELIKKSPYYKATSNDIDWNEKVKMQGEVQKWVDHSISVTINLPENTSEKTVDKLYKTAWEVGCKGVTVYRDGSRSGVLIKNDDKKITNILKENNAQKRPKTLECEIVNFVNNKEKWIGFLGMYEDKDTEKYPYELFTGLYESFPIPNYVDKGWIKKHKDEKGNSQYDFIYIDKDGYKITMGGLNRAFNREFWNTSKMLSAMLRHKIHLPTVLNLVDSLQINGINNKNGNNNVVFGTWQSGVKRILKKYLKSSHIENIEKICPDCGSSNLKITEGCISCNDCGWSKC